MLGRCQIGSDVVSRVSDGNGKVTDVVRKGSFGVKKVQDGD